MAKADRPIVKAEPIPPVAPTTTATLSHIVFTLLNISLHHILIWTYRRISVRVGSVDRMGRVVSNIPLGHSHLDLLRI